MRPLSSITLISGPHSEIFRVLFSSEYSSHRFMVGSWGPALYAPNLPMGARRRLSPFEMVVPLACRFGSGKNKGRAQTAQSLPGLPEWYYLIGLFAFCGNMGHGCRSLPDNPKTFATSRATLPIASRSRVEPHSSSTSLSMMRRVCWNP